MELTREQALSLHRQMWTDMQKDLGDCPSRLDRVEFKSNWCKVHFPHESILCACFLCEYAENNNIGCSECLIDWDSDSEAGCVNEKVSYRSSPISLILALPERKGTDKWN